MKDSKLNEIWARVNSFPAMPAEGARMLTLLEEPDTAVSEIEDILRYDPGLTANVLKLANSAYFGLPSVSRWISCIWRMCCARHRMPAVRPGGMRLSCHRRSLIGSGFSWINLKRFQKKWPAGWMNYRGRWHLIEDRLLKRI